ncbi:MAG TPA: putative baseplate assembly protein [Pyrinomonadaceae bacterium]|nr:putative baseplate assembly protein [Pyrinomonadaceae bacterium]
MKESKQNPATCDCCEGVEALTPIAIFNRPGLDAIAFRVGTHGSFLETMKARLSSSLFPRLASLTTRESRDASIALLDAWASVGDVLTFYQERIANEGYLRTAIERRSVLELARLVGYRLKPGLSASVYLAYTLEPTQDSTFIDIGNKAQSLPGPGELPQIFETAEKLTARSGVNAMKPRLTQPQFFAAQSFNPNTLNVAFKGTSLDLRVNDPLILQLTMMDPLTVNEGFYRINAVTTDPPHDRTIVTLNLAGTFANFPFVTLPDQLSASVDGVHAIALKYQDTAAFGLSATSKTVEKIISQIKALDGKLTALRGDTAVPLPDKLKSIDEELQNVLPELSGQYAFASSRGWDNIAAWLAAMITDLGKVRDVLEAPPPNTSTGSENGVVFETVTGVPSFVELFEPFKLPQSVQPNGEANLRRPLANIYSARSDFAARMYSVINPQAAPFVDAVLSNASVVQESTPSRATRGVIALTEGQVLRTRAFMAGHNLPVARNANNQIISPPTFSQYTTAMSDALFPVNLEDDLRVIALDAEYEKIKIGSRLVVRRPILNANGSTIISFSATIHTVQNVTTTQLIFNDVPVTVTVATLDRFWLPQTEMSAHTNSMALVRNTSVFAESEALTFAETEMSEDLGFESTDLSPTIELDGFYSNLESGRWTIISGERVVFDRSRQRLISSGVTVSELIMVAAVQHEAKTLITGELVELKGEKLHTFLRAAQPPAYRYRRNSVKIYGNVVRATHGETRNEVLGSGDGSKALQSFQLLQPPLTYLPAANPAGTETTLAVRINDVLWKESENLFALGGDERKYITKQDDEGKTTVIFGDGEHGSRLPTGVENIKAVYRQGIGKGGNVKADQIKLPLTKPLGVKAVTNPIPASGGVDKESRDQARRNVPIAVLALDRLVSVQDYADFARTFAGIGKASAQRLSDGQREVVHLTIAGAGNIPIDATSDLYRNLLEALARFGDPLQPLQVESFERVLLVVSAKVNVLPEYLWEKVKEQMRNLLFDRLGFENRELGQSVTLSEVLSLMQSVPGVNYVDFDILDSVSEQTLANANFGAQLKLKPRVNASLARINAQKDDILPAQLVFLSRDAVDTLILEEVTA